MPCKVADLRDKHQGGVGMWVLPTPMEELGSQLPGSQMLGGRGRFFPLWSSAAGAAGAAEGKAVLSLQPSCGAQQPLGRIPAAGNDNLTQRADLGALSSSKHSFLRHKRLKKPSCFRSSAAELEGGIKVPWVGREIKTLCLPFWKSALRELSLNK